MSVSTLESSKTPQSKGPDFHKVGENLYRLSTSGGYYALLKRGGKQYRKSLKTTDKEPAMSPSGRPMTVGDVEKPAWSYSHNDKIIGSHTAVSTTNSLSPIREIRHTHP